MNGDTTQSPSTRRERDALALRLLTVANAALYFVAAVLHLGLKIQLGFVTLGFPEAIPPATVVEGGIGAGLTAAAVAMFFRARRQWRLTWWVYLFALIGTLFGLAVALLRGLSGWDIWVHFVMLTGLAGGFVLLFGARRPGEEAA